VSLTLALRVAPAPAGFALSNAGVRSDVGGRDVTAQLQSQLRRSGHAFHTSAEVELLRGLKEAACYVARNPLAEEAAYRKEGVLGLLRAPLPAAGTSAGSAGAGGVPSTSAAATVSASSSGSGSEFVLPDGSRLVLGPERFRAAEVLFQPRLLGLEYSGAHEAVAVAVSKSDLELRRSLLQNVVLAGGATATRGFGERLLTELRRSLPPDAKVKIWAPAERKVLAWVGGSILASLGTFRGMCVSKEAWEEAGPAALARMATV
jgi:centractin